MIAAATSPQLTRNAGEILQLLRATRSFHTAQEVHASLRQQGRAIGLATVYRNLAALTRHGEVDSVVSASGETRYRSCSAGHHHHLVCRVCGVTVEVQLDAIEAWCRSTAETHGFRDIAHSVEILGTCPDCAQPTA